jgi:DNA-binding transcriptional regulator YhcF (GntR family)
METGTRPVSRTTVQKVINALSEAGFVEIKPRWGTFMAEQSGR